MNMLNKGISGGQGCVIVLVVLTLQAGIFIGTAYVAAKVFKYVFSG
jgi:uncharacterized protein YneF (UPF0154 family)